MTDPEHDFYDVNAWNVVDGRLVLDQDSFIEGITYTAAKEVISTLGTLHDYVMGIQRHHFHRDGVTYKRLITSRESPYEEYDSGGVTEAHMDCC